MLLWVPTKCIQIFYLPYWWKNFLFIVDFVPCLLLASPRSSKSCMGKSTKQEAYVKEFPKASSHFLLYVPLVSSDLTAHTHSNLNSSLRLTDK
jgi:hypothetical protein